MREMGSPEARICYERAEPLCRSLGRPRLQYAALIGLWRYCFTTSKLSGAMQIAERVHSLAQEQDDPTIMIWAFNVLAITRNFLGDFESARQYAIHGIQTWRSAGGQSHPEDVDTPVVGCFCHKALSEWHLGKLASCRAMMDEGISLARELKDMHALAIALNHAALLAYYERNPAEWTAGRRI